MRVWNLVRVHLVDVSVHRAAVSRKSTYVLALLGVIRPKRCICTLATYKIDRACEFAMTFSEIALFLPGLPEECMCMVGVVCWFEKWVVVTNVKRKVTWFLRIMRALYSIEPNFSDWTELDGGLYAGRNTQSCRRHQPAYNHAPVSDC